MPGFCVLHWAVIWAVSSLLALQIFQKGLKMTRNSASKPFYFHIEVYLGETGCSREGKNDDMNMQLFEW